MNAFEEARQQRLLQTIGTIESRIEKAWQHYDSLIRARPGAHVPRVERESFFIACRGLLKDTAL